MFKRKVYETNGLDDLRAEAEDSRAQRSLAARTLIRTLERLKRQRAEEEMAARILRFRKSEGL